METGAVAPKSCVPRPRLCCTPQAPAVQLGTESPCDSYLRLLEVDCSAAAGFGGGGGLCVAIALRDPRLGSESLLGSFPLESPTGALSFSSEPEVPRRMQEGGANNNSRSVLRLLVRYLHWPIPSYNSPLRSVQVLIYQMRKQVLQLKSERIRI